MLASDYALLVIIAALCVSIIAGVACLLIRGADAARSKGALRFSSRGAKDQIIWRDIARQPFRLLIGQLLNRLHQAAGGISRLVQADTRADFLQISDPVDGTGFEPGETIMRCACNTCYHLHTWNWLGDKNSGKCVNCDRAGMVSVIQPSAA
jgi:hypothetical protein